jgi:hypothetical protein
MKKLLGISVAVLGFLAFAKPAQAQIMWTTPTLAPTDLSVLTNGSYFDAATFNASGATVNGVTFNPISGTGDGASISLAYQGAVLYGAYSTAAGSTNISNAISNIGYVVGTPGSVTLSGLTAGNTYQVQVFNFDAQDSNTSVATTLSGSPSADFTSANSGGFSVGTFTADALGDPVTFNFSLDSGASYSIINAISVRDLGVAPEPSQGALMAIGLLGLVVLLRRKRLA